MEHRRPKSVFGFGDADGKCEFRIIHARLILVMCNVGPKFKSLNGAGASTYSVTCNHSVARIKAWVVTEAAIDVNPVLCLMAQNPPGWI